MITDSRDIGHRDDGCSSHRSPSLLFIIGTLGAGGAERQLTDLANYWADRAVRVTLATWSGPEVADFYLLSARVSRRWLKLGSLPWFATSMRRVMKLRGMVRALQPDAVLSFVDVSNVYSILATHGLGVRVVVAERTHPAVNRTVRWPWRFLRRLYYSRADLVVAQTQDAAAWIAKHCGGRVTVIPNSLRALPNLETKREPLIIAIGRLSKEKGYDLLLQAFARVAPDFPAWRVCIIGEGAERAELTEQCDRLQLSARVDFAGEIHDVETWMSRASLLVHASRREGFPNVLLEAMGMGLAVISADCRAGPSELIQDRVNGRLVPVDDVPALARVMSELMAQGRTRDELGSQARKVRERFAPDVIMNRWRACLMPQSEAEPTGIAGRGTEIGL
jgi:GalNAc-alpha-(1->4)-GalNAc-alpha-(1->3)-diNAcBac-PP-undecaprenol alpha-1,4-N-acetyl-D-galactosaminyltransferase